MSTLNIDQQIESQIEETKLDLRPSLTEIFRPDIPRDRSAREMHRLYDLSPNKDVGFFDKIGLAFSNETVISELWREINSPDYVPEENFRVSDEDIKAYASDIPEYQLNRVIATSKSFAEFIYESDQVRLTNKRRSELFSGGGFGMATGFGLTMLAAGGEAVALTLLATAIASPQIGAAAGVTNIATKLHRVKGMFKAMGIAGMVDVPLETTRYNLDKTLRPLDVAIAIGASAGISGAIGAWKPHLFLSNLEKMGRTAAVKEAADVARAVGKNEAAKILEKSIAQKASVRPLIEASEEIGALDRGGLFARAKELEIDIMRTTESGKKVQKKNVQLIQEILEKSMPQLNAEKAVATYAVARSMGINLLDESITLQTGGKIGTTTLRQMPDGTERQTRLLGTFTSHLTDTLRDLPQRKLSTTQLRGVLKKQGVKDEEVFWSGLDDYLKENPKVNLDEAMESIGNIRLEEVVKGGHDSVSHIKPTEHDHWTLPGGSDQTELLITWGGDPANFRARTPDIKKLDAPIKGGQERYGIKNPDDTWTYGWTKEDALETWRAQDQDKVTFEESGHCSWVDSIQYTKGS